jgi:5-methylcytosine-specific restriction endonuclease McrA
VEVSFDIDVRLTLGTNEATAGYFSNDPIAAAIRESERAMYAAMREWRRGLTHNGHRPHARRHTVYERDGWVCQLCLGPVDRRLRIGNPLCATLDHVLPQAHGGKHDLENLQLAHAICNHVRGDLPMKFVVHALFAEVRDEAIRWEKAQQRYRTAAARLERARSRFERRCRRARTGYAGGGLDLEIPSLRVLRIPVAVPV